MGLWAREYRTSFPCEKSVQISNLFADWFPLPFPGSTGSLAYNSSCDWLTRTTALQALKNQFSIDSQNNNNDTAAEEDNNLPRSFQNAVRYALFSKFSEIRQLKPVQEEALFKFIQRKDVFCPSNRLRKSLIFHVVPVV